MGKILCKICEGVKHNEVCEEHKELADNFWEKIEQNRKKANRLDKTLEWVCKEIERIKSEESMKITWYPLSHDKQHYFFKKNGKETKISKEEYDKINKKWENEQHKCSECGELTFCPYEIKIIKKLKEVKKQLEVE